MHGIELGCCAWQATATGSSLDFEPGVDIVGEQSSIPTPKLPQFVYVHEPVAHFQGFAHFGIAPCARQSALLVAVGTRHTLLV